VQRHRGIVVPSHEGRPLRAGSGLLAYGSSY
jgi:hypothetical protein